MVGVVALGDSIINGRTGPFLGVPGRSWARWLADSMRLDCTLHSLGGASSADVVDDQLPQIAGSYEVATVSVGANDVLYDWDIVRFEANLHTILTHLAEVAPEVLVSNLPSGFRQMRGVTTRYRQRTDAANLVIARAVEEHGAKLLDVIDMTGPVLMAPDLVHPTAVGLLEMGDRAARLCDVAPPSESLPPRANPTGADRLRYDYLKAKLTCRLHAKRLHDWVTAG